MKKLFLRSLGFFTSLVLLSTFLRTYFYFSTKGAFAAESTRDVLVAFWHGVRFDVSALLYLNIIILFLVYFLFLRKSRTVAFLFSILNSLYVGALIADVDFFLSYGKKVDLNFFTAVEGTKTETLLVMFGVYKHVFLVMGLSIFLFYKFFRFYWVGKVSKSPVSKYYLYFLVVAVLSFLGIRGGIQKRVLGIQHTMLYANGSSALSHLTSNTLHNLIRGKTKSSFPKVYEKGSISNYDPKRWEFEELGLDKKPKNVLFIFIESLSAYAVEKNGLLKKIRRDFNGDALYINDFYANGRLSLDAITASFFGIPSHFDLHLFNSKYVSNKWVGLSTVLENEGFESFFIHGATEGTQFFDVITKASGINDFYSVKDNYKVPVEMKAKWGVHDEFLYEKGLSIIRGYKAPFVGSFFTTSSHTPFHGVPSNRKSTRDVEKDYFLSLDYADRSLEGFFKAARKEAWFKDTLFIITGDHGPPILTKWNMSLAHDSRLPLILYYPGSDLGSLDHRNSSQHVDLPMTIFHMLGVKPEEWSSFGYSIFDKEIKTPVFYTGYGKRSLNMILSDSKKVSVGLKSPLDEKWSDVDSSIKNYVYRLEKDLVYKK